MEEKLVAEYPVIDMAGNKRTVFEYQDFIPMGVGASRVLIPGMMRLRFSSGEDVRRVDRATFEVVETGERLTRL